MTLLDVLLEQLKLRGITVEYRGDNNLALVGDTSKADEQLLATVKKFKPDLLHRLKGELAAVRRELPTVSKPHPRRSELCGKCNATVFLPGPEIGNLCRHGNLCPYYRKQRTE